MQCRLPVFLLILLSAPLCLGFQPVRPVIQLHEIYQTPESKAAQDQAVNARKHLLLASESAEKMLKTAATNNSPDIQAKVNEAQRQVAAAQQDAQVAENKAKAVQSSSITSQQWLQMQGVLQEEKNRYESSMNRNSAMAATLVVAGILLAMLSALAGFMRKSIAAGILSILVTTVVGIPRIFPISQRAEYYRALFVQSSSLLMQAQLRLNPTLADYNEFVHDIEVLAEYETNKFPSGGDVAQNTQDLIKEIAAASAPSH